LYDYVYNAIGVRGPIGLPMRLKA